MQALTGRSTSVSGPHHRIRLPQEETVHSFRGDRSASETTGTTPRGRRQKPKRSRKHRKHVQQRRKRKVVSSSSVSASFEEDSTVYSDNMAVLGSLTCGEVGCRFHCPTRLGLMLHLSEHTSLGMSPEDTTTEPVPSNTTTPVFGSIASLVDHSVKKATTEVGRQSSLKRPGSPLRRGSTLTFAGSPEGGGDLKGFDAEGDMRDTEVRTGVFTTIINDAFAFKDPASYEESYEYTTNTLVPVEVVESTENTEIAAVEMPPVPPPSNPAGGSFPGKPAMFDDRNTDLFESRALQREFVQNSFKKHDGLRGGIGETRQHVRRQSAHCLGWMLYFTLLALIPLPPLAENQRSNIYVWLYVTLVCAYALPLTRLYTEVLDAQYHVNLPWMKPSMYFVLLHFTGGAVCTIIQKWPFPVAMLIGPSNFLMATIHADSLVHQKKDPLFVFLWSRRHAVSYAVLGCLHYVLSFSYFLGMLALANNTYATVGLTVAFAGGTAVLKIIAWRFRHRGYESIAMLISTMELFVEFFTLFASPKVERVELLALYLLPELCAYLISLFMTHMAIQSVLQESRNDLAESEGVRTATGVVFSSGGMCEVQRKLTNLALDLQANVWAPVYYMCLGTAMRYGPARESYPFRTFTSQEWRLSVILSLLSLALSVLCLAFSAVYLWWAYGINFFLSLGDGNRVFGAALGQSVSLGVFSGILLHEYSGTFFLFFSCFSFDNTCAVV